MFQNLEVFQLAQSMAQHAGKLQVVAARNLANADTPGYAARSLTPFKDTLRSEAAQGQQRATRAGHLNGLARDGQLAAPPREVIDDSAMRDPNGNSVAIEDEILRSVDAKRQHDRALAIYRSSLNILRTSIGRA